MLDRPKKPVASAEESSRDLSVRRSPSVLLVDDGPHTAGVLVKLLRADGFEVEQVADAAAAVRRVERGPAFDVLIIDVSPARAGDLEAIRTIRARCRSLAVIIITAHPQLTEPLGLESGAPWWTLVKPVDYRGLLAILQVLA